MLKVIAYWHNNLLEYHEYDDAQNDQALVQALDMCEKCTEKYKDDKIVVLYHDDRIVSVFTPEKGWNHINLEHDD